MLIKKDSGVSLVELLLVVGMLGGVSLIAMNLSKQTTKSSVKYQFDSDITATVNEINGILSNPANCKESLLNKVATSDTSITGLIYKPATTPITKFPINTSFGNSGIKILSYGLSGFASGSLQGPATFTINFERKNILGGGNLSKTITLYVRADADNKIQSCNTVAVGAGGQWTTAINDIYNSNTGNVGIGTTSPGAKLDIEGGNVIIHGTGSTIGLIINNTLISSAGGLSITASTQTGATLHVHDTNARGFPTANAENRLQIDDYTGSVFLIDKNANATLAGTLTATGFTTSTAWATTGFTYFGTWQGGLSCKRSGSLLFIKGTITNSTNVNTWVTKVAKLPVACLPSAQTTFVPAFCWPLATGVAIPCGFNIDVDGSINSLSTGSSTQIGQMAFGHVLPAD